VVEEVAALLADVEHPRGDDDLQFASFRVHEVRFHDFATDAAFLDLLDGARQLRRLIGTS
jgi:hypothetical protein